MRFFNYRRFDESVVKDREQCCLLTASIVRREGEIICKDSGRWTGNSHPTDEELSLHPSEQRSLPSPQRAKIARYHPKK